MNATATITEARRQQAEARLLVIRNALEVADQELGRALAERDWEAFDLPSFEAYCAERLPELAHIKLRTAQRRERTRALLDAKPDATVREVAAATGAAKDTAHRDMRAVTGREPAPKPAAVAVDAPTHVVVARAIGTCGAAGGTTREVMNVLGWEQGPASVALSRAARKGLVTPTGDRRHAHGSSPGFTVYVVA